MPSIRMALRLLSSPPDKIQNNLSFPNANLFRVLRSNVLDIGAFIECSSKTQYLLRVILKDFYLRYMTLEHQCQFRITGVSAKARIFFFPWAVSF